MAAKKFNKKIPVKQKGGATAMLEDCAFTRYIAENADGAQAYAGAMRVLENLGTMEWRGDAAVPPGSPPHDILEAFRVQTDLPLDLAWHSFLFYLSTYFMSRGVTLEVEGQTITPELWTVVLAPSGSGKSYSLARIKNGSPVAATISGIASGAKLIETMRDNEAAGKPNAMLVDEFGQMLKSLETEGSPLFDAKQYLLLAYDGDTIERNTKRESVVVQDSKLTFLGLNVTETFAKAMSLESMTDGFAQRFAYCLAESDPARMFYDYSRYSNATINEVVAKAWTRLLAVPLNSQYTYSSEALAAYDEEFRTTGKMIHAGKQINVSFFRRLMQRTHKLALLMHFILGDASPVISKTAMCYAIRQTRLHITDAAKLIAMKSPNSNAMLKSVDELAQRLAQKGKKLTPREVRGGIHAARSDQELATILVAAYKNMQGEPEATPTRKAARPPTPPAHATSQPASILPTPAATIAKPLRAPVAPKPSKMDINDLIRDHRDDKGASVYTG